MGWWSSTLVSGVQSTNFSRAFFLMGNNPTLNTFTLGTRPDVFVVSYSDVPERTPASRDAGDLAFPRIFRNCQMGARTR